MDDSNERVRLKACYAMEAFCQNLGSFYVAVLQLTLLVAGDRIAPYLTEVMTKLVGLLAKSDVETQEIAVAAISAVAEAAGASFLPFYSKLIEMMQIMMQQVAASPLVLP